MNVTARRKALSALIEQHGVLNTYQACRMLNKYGKDEFKRCYFTFKEKPLRSTGLACRNTKFHTCKTPMSNVRYALNTMKLRSTKMRAHDKGGIGTDLFRFYYRDPRRFERQVLNQTLIPYTRKRAVPQSSISEW